MLPSWNSAHAQNQIRNAIQSLRQLQDKKYSDAQISRRDIATLLKQANVLLARAKAYNLLKHESICDLFDILDSYCAFLLEHYKELEKSQLSTSPGPLYIEASASVIYAVEHLRTTELYGISDLLKVALGPDFYHSATYNTENHVSHKVILGVGFVPSPQAVDNCLWSIAQTYKVDWLPSPSAQEKLNVLPSLLDESDVVTPVDLQTVRRICASGIPYNPPLLRPRLWKLLLGYSPLDKANWGAESSKKRTAYYDIVRQSLSALSSGLSTQPSPFDRKIQAVHEALASVNSGLYVDLDNEPLLSSECPLNASSPEAIRIPFATCLEDRLRQSATEAGITKQGTPEIRLEGDDADSVDSQSNGHGSSTLHASLAQLLPAHPGHASALLRLLYIHASLHPESNSPHTASLLVTLYSVMNQEVEPSEVTHVEADTFWLLQLLCTTLSEIEDEDGAEWMKKINARLASVDVPLLERLQQMGLDPALPHYSFQWLDSMMSCALPFLDVLTVWDAVLSQPELERQSNPRLEHLVDISAAMLIGVRRRLMRSNHSVRRPSAQSLWGDDTDVPPSPMKPWELGVAFEECLAMLRDYPVAEAGGIERIIQMAGDIQTQRLREEKQGQGQWGETLKARFRGTMFGGLMQSPVASTNTSHEVDESGGEEDDTETEGEETQTEEHVPNSQGWTSRLTTTVWRGITNQSAMDVPPSPMTPEHPPSPTTRSPNPNLLSPTRYENDQHVNAGGAQSQGFATSLWRYATKLKDSDVAATLSKTSSNWSARAISVMNRSASTDNVPATTMTTMPPRPSSEIRPMVKSHSHSGSFNRRGSAPIIQRRDDYSPPPRPAHFRPPRDSRIDFSFSPPEPDSPELANTSDHAGSGSEISAKLASLAPTTLLKRVASSSGRSQSASPKPPRSAPRPLMLNAASLVTPLSDVGHTRSATSSPTPHQGQWSDVLRQKVQHGQAPSISSSVTSPGVNGRNSEVESDNSATGSRVVRLNRSSVSPMAPAFLSRQRRVGSTSSLRGQAQVKRRMPTDDSRSQGTSTETGDESSFSRSRGWDMVNAPDSPSTLASPPPKTPTNFGQMPVKVSISEEERRGSLTIREPERLEAHAEQPLQPSKMFARKTSFPRRVDEPDDTSDSSLAPISPRVVPPPPRLRSKRYGGKALNVRTGNSTSPIERSPVQQESPQFGNLGALVAPDNELDMIPTPRAADFSPSIHNDRRIGQRSRKTSTEEREQRPRKVSQDANSAKARKAALEAYHRRSESAADEGDDEGYDELLSAYESEEGFR